MASLTSSDADDTVCWPLRRKIAPGPGGLWIGRRGQSTSCSRQAAEDADRTAAGLRRDHRLIMDTLGIGLLDPQYSRSDMLDKNPMVWMLQVDGLVVDAR